MRLQLACAADTPDFDLWRAGAAWCGRTAPPVQLSQDIRRARFPPRHLPAGAREAGCADRDSVRVQLGRVAHPGGRAAAAHPRALNSRTTRRTTTPAAASATERPRGCARRPRPHLPRLPAREPSRCCRWPRPPRCTDGPMTTTDAGTLSGPRQRLAALDIPARARDRRHGARSRARLLAHRRGPLRSARSGTPPRRCCIATRWITHLLRADVRVPGRDLAWPQRARAAVSNARAVAGCC